MDRENKNGSRKANKEKGKKMTTSKALSSVEYNKAPIDEWDMSVLIRISSFQDSADSPRTYHTTQAWLDGVEQYGISLGLVLGDNGKAHQGLLSLLSYLDPNS